MARKAKVAATDPVTAYATAVLAGEIMAGRAVRLASERHMRDLERQDSKGFPYRWVPDRIDVDGQRSEPSAMRAIAFFPDFLCLEDGSPFILTAWQRFVIGSLFGWLDAKGNRRFREAFILTGKGSGKTPMLAGIGLYGLIADGEPAAQIYSLGVTRDQAAYLFKYAHDMAERSPELHDLLGNGIQEHNILWKARSSYFRPLSSEGRSLDNKLPHMALIDEIQEHPTSVVVTKMQAGTKRRKNSLIVEITNAGYDRTSICWQHTDYSHKVLAGIVTDERWFTYVCQLDPCPSCSVDGFMEPKDGCSDCDDWTNPAVWLKANPSLGVTIDHEYLERSVARALAMPSDQALVKRLNFCLWTVTHQVWIPADAWDACKVPAVGQNLEGARAAAFDMSEKLDLTACVVGIKTEAPNEPEQVVEITDTENGEEVRKRFALNFYVDLIPFFWLPRDTLIQRVKTERIPFDVWERSGYLRVTPGPVIDYDQIYKEFCGEIAKRYRPTRIGYDPWNATQFALQLRDKAKHEVVEVAQGKKLSESFKLFEALVRLRRIRHDGNPVLAWCVSNAEPKRDDYENLWVTKPSHTKRIDGLIAAVMVLNQLKEMPIDKPRKRGVARIWRLDKFYDAIPEQPVPA